MNWNRIINSPAARSCGIIVIALVVMLTVAWLQAGKSLVEKTATSLLMPTGIVWLFLSWNVLYCFMERHRWKLLIGCLAWLLYWVTAAELTARVFSDQLESPYNLVNPTQHAAFDHVLVLGGGVKTFEDKFSVGHAGDRVVLAARLYHAGKIRHLVVSGEFYEWSGETHSIAEVTKKLLVQLKVPPSAITKIKGRNTFEEFRELKSLVAAKSIESVGVITSATHMPRAMRLATSNGLNVTPIAADFERSLPGPLVLDIIPTQSGLRKSTRSLKEYLARLAGR